MKLKDLNADVTLFNKHRFDNKRFYKEYIGFRFEHLKEFRPIINQLRMQNYQNANDMLEELVRDKQNNIDAYRFRGEFYFTYQQYQAAWEQYDQILKIESRHKEALLMSSACAFILNERAEYEERMKVLKFIAPQTANKLDKYLIAIQDFLANLPIKNVSSQHSTINLIILYGKSLPDSGEISPSLLTRLEKVLSLAKKNQQSDILALGGPVHNKHIEALTVYNWLSKHGIAEQRLILDMTGLDVVIQTLAVIDFLKEKPHKKLWIVSENDVLPRQFFTLRMALKENGFTDVKLTPMGTPSESSEGIPEIERLKIWHSVLRAVGIFAKDF